MSDIFLTKTIVFLNISVIDHGSKNRQRMHVLKFDPRKSIQQVTNRNILLWTLLSHRQIENIVPIEGCDFQYAFSQTHGAMHVKNNCRHIGRPGNKGVETQGYLAIRYVFSVLHPHTKKKYFPQQINNCIDSGLYNLALVCNILYLSLAGFKLIDEYS